VLVAHLGWAGRGGTGWKGGVWGVG
jgi:hypothetical protein